MKILILINEDFLEMYLGQNSTLSYILAAVDLGHDVYVKQIPQNKISYLNSANAKKLVEEYKMLNSLENRALVKDACTENFPEVQISNDEIDFVIQRLEPMKSPFPPVGKIDIRDYLDDLQQQEFPHKLFNNPSECHSDKELPLVLNKFNNEIATPTIIANFDSIPAIPYKKIVIKPQNSAQSFGVFAIEFTPDGDDLKHIEAKNLMPYGSFKIKDSCHIDELTKIIKILCYVQYLKTIPQFLEGKYTQVQSYSEIMHGINSLYGDTILIQPYLEGVSQGDIRINLAKNHSGNFEIVGSVFRKNINEDSANFTTGVTSGHARATRVEEVITEDEEKNLTTKIHFILEKLNNELKDKYKNCLELGCDFLLKGDKKTVFLGEINHYCPALVPLSEALENKARGNSFYQKIGGVKINYDGGLAVMKYIINEQISI